MPARARTATPADITFGEAMDRLETIVTQLEESEELGLEQGLALYEQGLALAGDCQKRLTSARLRLTEIVVPPLADPADTAS